MKMKKDKEKNEDEKVEKAEEENEKSTNNLSPFRNTLCYSWLFLLFCCNNNKNFF